jgi:hypothetical protein
LGLSKVGALAEGAHAAITSLEKVKTTTEFIETLAGIGGYSGFAEAVQGKFVSGKLSPLSRHNDRTALQIAVTSDQFPNYGLTIQRNGTTLPWATDGLTMVVNPFGANGPGVIVNSQSSGQNFSSGEQGVDNVLAATAPLKGVGEGVKNHANVGWAYLDNALSLSSVSDSSKTISWNFLDGNP